MKHEPNAMTEPTILYQDDQIVVINKPTGMPVHAAAHVPHEGTLAAWLVQKFPQIAEVGEKEVLSDGTQVTRPGIVHRLDRDTSGIMVAALTHEAFESLREQFSAHEVRKIYRAFVYGVIADDRGIINKPIGRTRGSGSHRGVRDTHGTMREAQTTFRTMARRGKGNDGASYLEVFPTTGRTHQIRVHLSAIQHPIVCDPLYGRGKPPLFGFDRLALHALSLTFIHPTTGQQVSFEAPLPADFQEAERQMKE